MELVNGAAGYDFEKAVGLDADWEGWKVTARDLASQVLSETYEPASFDPDPVLETLIGMGWVASRWARYHAAAWTAEAAPIVRLDFLLEASRQWRIRRWKAGWLASTLPSADELKPRGWQITTATSWLLAHAPADHMDMGWRWRQAGNFLRAWYGRILPVRNKAQIIRMRDALRDYRHALARRANGETWVEAVRPAWMPESLSLTLDEIEAQDFAYML